jgi:hypothetical protein
MINPNHGKGDEETVTHWNTLLLGQDLRTRFVKDIFEDDKLQTKLDAIKPPLNPEQQLHVMKTLTALPNDLGIIQGGAGTGKKLFDIATALLMVKQGKKVLFLGPTNGSVDDYATKIHDMFLANGMTEPKVIRHHALQTERDLADSKAKKPGEDPEEDPEEGSQSWSGVSPVDEMLWEKTAFDIMDPRHRTPGGVKDRRMRIINQSMGMAVLKRVRYTGPSKDNNSLFGSDPTRQDQPTFATSSRCSTSSTPKGGLRATT